MTEDAAIRQAAARHGFSERAAQALAQALRRSGGSMAQFDHPELGGMGQWTRGGMLMIGDMFNDALKARVGALARDLAEMPAEASGFRPEPGLKEEGARQRRWWPEELGEPASTGGQNDMRYAVFPHMRRLAVERNGKVTLHDTLDYAISGVAQQQGSETRLSFSDRSGGIDLDKLPVVP